MGALCPASIEPLSYHFSTLSPTPFSSHTAVVAVLLEQHVSAQGPRLVTTALGPERLGGKGAAK